MRSTLLSLAALAATGAGFLAAAPVAAHADAGKSALILTSAHGSRSADTPLSSPRRVVLACDPEPAGTHPDARSACTTLQQVNADFAAIAPGRELCPLDYAPVTVTARGYWDDAWVEYEREFPNACAAARDTGGVFRF